MIVYGSYGLEKTTLIVTGYSAIKKGLCNEDRSDNSYAISYPPRGYWVILRARQLDVRIQ